MRHAWRSAVLLSVALTVLAACGVPLDEDPREIAISSTTTSEARTSTTRGSDGTTATVYLVDQNGGLRGDEVALEAPGVAGAVSALLSADPPTGLKSQIPSGTRLLELRTRGRRVTVDLSAEMHDISSPLDRIAYAQIAFTALEFPEYVQIEFEIEGQAVDAPTDDGNREVVTANDYLYPLNPT